MVSVYSVKEQQWTYTENKMKTDSVPRIIVKQCFVLFEQEETEKLPTIKRLFFPTTNTIYIMQEEFESIRHQLSLDFE